MFLILNACSNGDDHLELNQEHAENVMPICWNVVPEVMLDSRSLINSTLDLEKACSGEQGIGIWSLYELDNTFKEHVLGANDDVTLVYRQNTTWEHYNGWTYGQKYAFWKNRAVYYFNAYYPNTADIWNTKAALQGNYDTETTQTDLMVARTMVNTASDDFKGSPVKLSMKHALAAIQFQFQALDDLPIKLTSFTLKNKDTQGLITAGMLTYTDEGMVWIPNDIIVGQFYEWSYSVGLEFTNQNEVTAYTPVNEDNLYTTNDGYILIIPQTYNGGKTEMIFTTDIKTIPFEVSLPAPTKTGNKFLPGYRYTYIIKMSKGGNKVTLECDVQPWNLQEEDMVFDDQVSINEGGQLVWNKGTYQGSISTYNAEVTLSPGIPLTGQFTINTPTGATWHAEFIPQDAGSVNAFVFDKGDGTTSATISGNVGEPATLSIRPVNTSIANNKKALLRICVKTGDGRTIVVRELMPSGFQNSEYTIIQSI